MDLTLWLELILFGLLIILSGFFSSSETSLFSLSKTQIDKLLRDSHPRIKLIKRMLSEPRRLIVTILIGNELVNVAASVISAAVIIQILGADNKWINLFVMVPILLLFGEITPKTLAIRNNIRFATVEAPLIEIFARIITPLRWVIRKIADHITTRIVGKERSRGNIITEDMVRVLAREAAGTGELNHIEAQFIEDIFDFGNMTVESVMTPRSHIFFLPVDMPLAEMVAEFRRTHHTKVPIYKGHRDTIIGFLYARDLLSINVTQAGEQRSNIRRLLRKPYFVPESKSVAGLFHVFRERKQSVALTVDEYGGVTGLVTMEDLLECIFGEIHSPSEANSPDQVKKLENGHYEFHGQTPITTINAILERNLSIECGETIAGLLLHHYGELPTKGACIDIDELRFTVTAITGNRIESIELEINEPATVTPAADTIDDSADETDENLTTASSAVIDMPDDSSAGNTTQADKSLTLGKQ